MDGQQHERHEAIAWVERSFPAARGDAKVALILAYGAGFDAGMAEAQQIVLETALEVIHGTETEH